ncbi:hypothetical protein EJ07DRAFT_150298 [Lizonia empirigonia]|nr:hypothetical protein EJ07DRAFT_150298 [Lizonia empirigonia]
MVPPHKHHPNEYFTTKPHASLSPHPSPPHIPNSRTAHTNIIFHEYIFHEAARGRQPGGLTTENAQYDVRLSDRQTWEVWFIVARWCAACRGMDKTLIHGGSRHHPRSLPSALLPVTTNHEAFGDTFGPTAMNKLFVRTMLQCVVSEFRAMSWH